MQLTWLEKASLTDWITNPNCDGWMRTRARIVLQAAGGLSVAESAKLLRTAPSQIRKWLARFEESGLTGLVDRLRSGAPSQYTASDSEQLLDLARSVPPGGREAWNGQLLAQEFRRMSSDKVWRVMRDQQQKLARRRSWSVNTKPVFTATQMDIVGLYRQGGHNALLICTTHELLPKERQQACLRMPTRKAGKAFQESHLRPGDTTLSKALEGLAEKISGVGSRLSIERLVRQAMQGYPLSTFHILVDSMRLYQEATSLTLKHTGALNVHYLPTRESWLSCSEMLMQLISGRKDEKEPLEVRRLLQKLAQPNDSPDPATPAFEWVKTPKRTNAISVRKIT